MKKSFPLHGILGITLLVLSEFLHFKKIDPFYSWFYCFAWWSYILTIDAIIYRLKGNSLMLSRTKEFLVMIPWSIFIWLIFEAANLSLENWYYINLPNSTVERWLGYAVAYGTVLPGIFETTELLETVVVFRESRIKRTVISQEGHRVFILLGVLSLVSSVLVPEYFFPLIWVGFIFLLEPFNYRFGGKSLLKDLEDGNPRKIYLLLTAGLICGLLWEFWNFWAHSKWVYTVPFFEELKGFEMPALGFLGFPPFAVQVYVMYNFISLFRFQRRWEDSAYRLHPEKKSTLGLPGLKAWACSGLTLSGASLPRLKRRGLAPPNGSRSLTVILTAILIASFSILIFGAIDLKTVDSFETGLQDAYWIDPRYRKELPKVGISTLDDLILKTKDRKEREELALRLLVPKERLILWIEKAKLVQLKGMGVENLLVLEKVGIHSVSALAIEDPEKLYTRMKQFFREGPIPKKARIRIWIKEAKKVR